MGSRLQGRKSEKKPGGKKRGGVGSIASRNRPLIKGKGEAVPSGKIERRKEAREAKSTLTQK